jgi:hypothetical protein
MEKRHKRHFLNQGHSATRKVTATRRHRAKPKRTERILTEQTAVFRLKREMITTMDSDYLVSEFDEGAVCAARCGGLVSMHLLVASAYSLQSIP